MPVLYKGASLGSWSLLGRGEYWYSRIYSQISPLNYSNSNSLTIQEYSNTKYQILQSGSLPFVLSFYLKWTSEKKKKKKKKRKKKKKKKKKKKLKKKKKRRRGRRRRRRRRK